MPIKVQLRKKSSLVWQYVNVDVTPNKSFSSSKQHLFMEDNNIEFTEPYGNDFIKNVTLSEVAIYDDTSGGSQEVFTDAVLFQQRLVALQNPAFYQNTVTVGDVDGGTP